jgi:hypothetical protein
VIVRAGWALAWWPSTGAVLGPRYDDAERTAAAGRACGGALSWSPGFGGQGRSCCQVVCPVLRHGAGACPVGRLPAGEIEAAVIDRLRAVFRQPEIVVGTWKAARKHNPEITEADARDALAALDPLWDELFPAEQARIVQLLGQMFVMGRLELVRPDVSRWVV